MKEVLRQRALELGFDDCRVTTAEAPGFAARYSQWLAERRHGDMAYLERTAPKRVDPQQVLAGARSVITLAVSYHNSICQLPMADSRAAPAEGISRLQPPASTPHESAELAEAENGKSQMADGKFGLVARYARYLD